MRLCIVVIAHRVKPSLRTFNLFFTLQNTVRPRCVQALQAYSYYDSSREFTIFRERSENSARVARSVIQIYYTCIALCLIMCTHITRILYIMYACVL